MIRINNLSKSFEGKSILQGINISFFSKESHILFGKNGEGKSTLLKCICGLIKPDEGKIDFINIDNKNFGLVLDNNLLIPKLKVREYLEFICELKKIEDIKKIKSLITDLDFITEENTLIEKLSKGTKSKLSLASALLYNPNVLILDEPFSGMDLITLEKAKKLIKKQIDGGCTVIISTHQAELLPYFMDKISILKNGIIEDTLSQKELSEKLKSERLSMVEYLKKII